MAYPLKFTSSANLHEDKHPAPSATFTISSQNIQQSTQMYVFLAQNVMNPTIDNINYKVI